MMKNKCFRSSIASDTCHALFRRSTALLVVVRNIYNKTADEVGENEEDFTVSMVVRPQKCMIKKNCPTCLQISEIQT